METDSWSPVVSRESRGWRRPRPGAQVRPPAPGARGRHWSAGPVSQSVLDPRPVHIQRYSSQWSSGIMSSTHWPSHLALICCDSLADDCCNMRLFLDNKARESKMYQCVIQVSLNASVCEAFTKFPKVNNSNDLNAPCFLTEAGDASNLILQKGHGSQQPVLTLCMF